MFVSLSFLAQRGAATPSAKILRGFGGDKKKEGNKHTRPERKGKWGKNREQILDESPWTHVTGSKFFATPFGQDPKRSILPALILSYRKVTLG